MPKFRSRSKSHCVLEQRQPPELDICTTMIIQEHLVKDLEMKSDWDDQIDEENENSSNPSESWASMVGLVSDGLF